MLPLFNALHFVVIYVNDLVGQLKLLNDGADLSKALLINANLSGANLQNANLSGVDLSDVFIDENTNLNCKNHPICLND